MRTWRLALFALTALVLLAATAASAGVNTDVTYRLYHYEAGNWVLYYSNSPFPAGGDQAGTNRWKYEYTVTNKNYAGSGITTWYAFFNSNNVLCSTWALASGPTGWTPTKQGPLGGNYNWKERFQTTLPGGNPVTMGNSLTGFAVEFTWVCHSIPGPQNCDTVTSAGSESSVTIEESLPVPVESRTWGSLKAVYR